MKRKIYFECVDGSHNMRSDDRECISKQPCIESISVYASNYFPFNYAELQKDPSKYRIILHVSYPGQSTPGRFIMMEADLPRHSHWIKMVWQDSSFQNFTGYFTGRGEAHRQNPPVMDSRLYMEYVEPKSELLTPRTVFAVSYPIVKRDVGETFQRRVTRTLFKTQCEAKDYCRGWNEKHGKVQVVSMTINMTNKEWLEL